MAHYRADADQSQRHAAEDDDDETEPAHDDDIVDLFAHGRVLAVFVKDLTRRLLLAAQQRIDVYQGRGDGCGGA